MEEQEKRANFKKRVIFTFLSVLTFLTLAFFVGQYFLPNNWHYIPESAIVLVMILDVLWLITSIAILHYFSGYLKRKIMRGRKGIITISSMVLGIFVVLVIGYNSFKYTLNLEEKIEQYDSHIALYVDNTFVRVEHRYPHYMYEENWLLMRTLDEEELKDAILKYGNPDAYYTY